MFDSVNKLADSSCQRVVGIKLQQIPQVAVEVFKNGHHAVILLFGRTDELNSFFNHLVVVAPEVVGVEKEEDPTASLVADEGFLLMLGGARQQQRGARGIRRRDNHPAFILLRLVGVFNQREMQLLRVKGNGFVVITHDQGNVHDGLFHFYPLISIVVLCWRLSSIAMSGYANQVIEINPVQTRYTQL